MFKNITIDDSYILNLSFIPLYMFISDLFFSASVSYSISIMSFGLVLGDRWNLRKKNKSLPSVWYLLFYPAYLWRRDKIDPRKTHFFKLWLFITSMAFGGIWFDIIREERNNLAHAACKSVTEIMNKLDPSTECIKVVKIESENENGVKSAWAILSIGMEIPISIKMNDERNIFVTLSYPNVMSYYQDKWLFLLDK